MTYSERMLIEQVEKNRGNIKNTKKYYPMLCDIKIYGLSEWVDEVAIKKNFGIGFIHNVCIKLNKKEQLALHFDIFDGSKVTVAGAKLKLMKYL